MWKISSKAQNFIQFTSLAAPYSQRVQTAFDDLNVGEDTWERVIFESIQTIHHNVGELTVKKARAKVPTHGFGAFQNEQKYYMIMLQ